MFQNGHLVLMQVTMMDLDMVPPGSFQTRCDFVFEQLQSYCRGASLELHMTGLTKGLLGCATVAEFPTACLACNFLKL